MTNTNIAMRNSIIVIALIAFATNALADESHDFYQSGDYANKELAKRINKKLDAEDTATKPDPATNRFYDKLDGIYEDAKHEIENE